MKSLCTTWLRTAALILLIGLGLASSNAFAVALGDSCNASGMPGTITLVSGQIFNAADPTTYTCTAASTPTTGMSCGASTYYNGSTCVADGGSCTPSGGGSGTYSSGVCVAPAPTPTPPAISGNLGTAAASLTAGATPSGTQQPVCVNATPFVGYGIGIVAGTVLCYSAAGQNANIYAYSTGNGWDGVNLQDLYARGEITALGSLSVYGGAQIYSPDGKTGVVVVNNQALMASSDSAGNSSSVSVIPTKITSVSSSGSNSSSVVIEPTQVTTSSTDGSKTSSVIVTPASVTIQAIKSAQEQSVITTSATSGINIDAAVASGAGAAVRIDGTVSGNNTSHTGVLITGDGNGASNGTVVGGIANWADVALQSKNYGTLNGATNGLGSAVIVNDYGVQIVGPNLVGGGVSTNSIGSGANNQANTTVNNDIGQGGAGTVNNNMGQGGTGTVNNTIGQGSSGTVNNDIGQGGTGTVNNTIGQGSSGIVNNDIGHGSTGTVTNTIGQGSSGTLSNTIGEAAGSGTVTNNVGTGSGVSVNNIGNTNANTTIAMSAGSSSLNMSNGSISMNAGTPLATNGSTGMTSAIGSGAMSVYSSARQISITDPSEQTIGNSLFGKSYQNKVNGNLYVDGNVYINGTLDYVSSDSANTTVSSLGSGSSILAGAGLGTSGESAIVMRGTNTNHAVVDQNGKIAMISSVAEQSSASLTLTNGLGNTHGIIIQEQQTTISGGTQSSSLTLNDNGARFSNSATGAPIKVTGVNDGSSDFDAVNYRQLRNIAASAAAMSNIPQLQQNKAFSMGLGIGYFGGQAAYALGGNWRVADSTLVRATLASGASSGARPSAGLGAAISW